MDRESGSAIAPPVEPDCQTHFGSIHSSKFEGPKLQEIEDLHSQNFVKVRIQWPSEDRSHDVAWLRIKMQAI